MYSGHRFLDPATSEAEALELLNCASPSISPFFCSFLKVFYFFLIDQYAWMLNHSVVSDSLGPQGLQPTRLLCPRNFPDKNTGVGCHFLLQGIFLTEESNPNLLHLLHWQVDSLPLSHVGSQLTDIARHKKPSLNIYNCRRYIGLLKKKKKKMSSYLHWNSGCEQVSFWWPCVSRKMGPGPSFNLKKRGMRDRANPGDPDPLQ